MEFEQQEDDHGSMPVSPIAQYFNSSVLSLCVIGILEMETPIHDLPTMALLKDVFLPINPRFSSIMDTDKNGTRHWKKVEVNLKNHVKYPIFPPGLSPTCYDDYMSEYLTNIGLEELPQSQPLWEVHLVTYPTTGAAGTVVFKIHHALGDGYSLMGALLSCLQRADDPSLPMHFPSRKSQKLQHNTKKNVLMSTVPQFFSSVFNTVMDFGWSLAKSSVLEDEVSPIRSGNPLVQYLPMMNTSITFSLDQIKQIQSNLGVTVNDVITGIVFLGTRIYMKAIDDESSKKSINALVLLNTRMSVGYKSVEEMLHPSGSKPLWGNQFAFLHIPVPEFGDSEYSNPLEFMRKSQQKLTARKSSLGFVLVAKVLEFLRKYRGPEAAAKVVHNTLKNSSMAISNIIGPLEQVALANHPVSSIYFTVTGVPESLIVAILSYMGKLKVTIGCEKGFIVHDKYKSCIEYAFKLVLQASSKSK